MTLSFRILFYVIGGALLLSQLNPAEGWVRLIFVLAFIVAAAYVDHWIAGEASKGRKDAKLVSLQAHQQTRGRSTPPAARVRRVPQTVHSTTFHAEAESLLQVLREEGLHPMMVMQNRTGGPGGPVYEIRVREQDMARARALVEMFVSQSVRRPS